MNKEIVVIVKSEQEAYEAIKALAVLGLEGSIEVYASAVIKKNNGEVIVLRDNHAQGPLGTMLGASVGALIGLLGGPAGAVAGAAVGGTAGAATDMAYAGISGDLVSQVSTKLNEGNHAVIASVWEDWTVPVNTAMAPFGGVVFRSTTDEIATAHIRAEVKALKDDQAHVKEELKRSAGEAKTKLEAQLQEMQAKQKAGEDQLRKKADALEQRWNARFSNIKERAATAKAEARKRHEEHLAKLSRFSELQRESFKQLFA